MLGRRRLLVTTSSSDLNESAVLGSEAEGADPDEDALGQLLVERGALTEEQLRNALDRRPESALRLGPFLVQAGVIDERTLVPVLAEHLGLRVADLRQVTPEATALDLMPEKLARAQLALPLQVEDGHVDIAVAEPSTSLEQFLASQTGKRVRLLVAPTSDLRRAIDTHYRALGGIGQLVQAFEALEGRRRRTGDTADALATAEEAPVIRLCDLIMTQGLRDRASDVHIEPQDGRVRVRFRVDGALHDVITLPAAMGPGLVSRIKIQAGMNIVERRRPQDGQLTAELDGRSVDVRVSTVATIWGEKCVLRLLDKTRSLLKLHDLGMPAPTHEHFSKMCRAPFGMVICAGPTGSGKTTTLYATLSEIDDPSRNIMTVEDPVEYVFPSINQIQTNEQAGLTFATGLRSILRQDPDAILVGEIRDVETARIAVQSALSGHFVMSSLHATDSVSALHRFLDMGIESFLISSSVIGIVGQRLVRRICPSCKAPYQPTDEELAFYQESGGPPKEVFHEGEGCNFCAFTGYRDRIGVFELLPITTELKRLIVGWATQDELRRLAQQQGMRTLREEAVDLIVRDVTTISEVVRSIYAV
jgi:type IV pilus assembly protein PilB